MSIIADFYLLNKKTNEICFLYKKEELNVSVELLKSLIKIKSEDKKFQIKDINGLVWLFDIKKLNEILSHFNQKDQIYNNVKLDAFSKLTLLYKKNIIDLSKKMIFSEKSEIDSYYDALNNFSHSQSTISLKV